LKFAHADVLHILCICARWEIGVTFCTGVVAVVDAAAGHVNTVSAFQNAMYPMYFPSEIHPQTRVLSYTEIGKLFKFNDVYLLRPYSVTKQHIRH
jgi:hypothetical protein